MVPTEEAKRLTEISNHHNLTVYFNTGPDLPRAGYAARLRGLLRHVEPSVPPADRKPYEQAVAKVTNFLSQYQPAGSSLLVFAGPRSWDEFASRVPVRDEASWGRPDTAQLLWLMEEYRPYGVLVVGVEHVRFLAVRLNEFEAYKEFRTEVDTSSRLRGGSRKRGGVGQKGGRSADTFDQRTTEQVRHFWKSLHKPLAELVERHRIRRLVLAGTKSVVPEFARSLPPALSGLVVTQLNMETFTNPTDAVHKVFPQIEAWEQQREKALVDELFGAASISNKAAVGVNPVLKFVQDGRASRLVVAKGYDAEVTRCGKCLHVAPTANGRCAMCDASDVAKARLTAILPRLVVKHALPVEVVKGNAAAELTRSGGVGAFLRF